MELQWMMLLLTIFLLNQASGHNKYAKSANQKPANKNNSEPPSLKTLQKPFMMLKVNNVWSKAVLVRHNRTQSRLPCFSLASFRAKAQVVIQRAENLRQERKRLQTRQVGRRRQGRDEGGGAAEDAAGDHGPVRDPGALRIRRRRLQEG